LELKIREIYTRLNRFKENVNQAEKGESLARQMLFLAKANADIGVGDQEDYSEALKAILLTRAEYYKAVFDYNLVVGELEKELGM
ncbi:MAG: TolC family protein, partial [Pseudomonadota bacterium]